MNINLKYNRTVKRRASLLLVVIITLVVVSTRLQAQNTGNCGGQNVTIPFTDVAAGNIFFCSIAQAYFSGLTSGTSATTYSPSSDVPREQMAAFITRTLDASLNRGSRRAALDQRWFAASPSVPLAITPVGDNPTMIKSDGTDLWVANGGQSAGTVSRVRASDGRLLETWTGAFSASGVLVALGRVFVTGKQANRIYMINPSQPPGAATVFATVGIGTEPVGIAFDGNRIWTANFGMSGGGGSVSIVTVLNGFGTGIIQASGFIHPNGILFDGANIWVTDLGDDSLKKLNSSGQPIQSTPVGGGPQSPVFDGMNIWVPNRFDNTITVVRAVGGLSGTVLATLSGNGLNGPMTVAFDGERILVTNFNTNSVSLWKATDLTPLGVALTAAVDDPTVRPFGACSDGINFWVTMLLGDKILRL